MTISEILLWPLRRLVCRLYRPYVELMKAFAVPGEAPSLGGTGERFGLAETRKRRSRHVGALLREYRELAGYSLTALSERVCISPEQLERWEIGVPVPPSDRVLALTDFLEIPERAVEEAAVCESAVEAPTVDEYGAAPVLENAIVFHGWTPDEVAEALATSPTKVQTWRLGAIEMTMAERLALSGLVRLRSERAGE
jgi:transcriptional regulator with XRE-family HTH domain